MYVYMNGSVSSCTHIYICKHIIQLCMYSKITSSYTFLVQNEFMKHGIV